ncbi:MAG: SpaA isopeptide-forming pilin-related protein [Ethanoligenens sp.]
MKTGSVQFTKKAPDGSNLAGAVFTLTGAGGYTQKVTSDQAGLVKFTDVPYGEYTLTETGAPVDYTIVAPVPVSLHDSTTNNTGSLTMNDMVDALKTGTIQFTKMAENGGTLSGAAFTLTGAGGYTQQVTSDQNGLVRFTGVPYGDYTIEETGVPAHYVAVSPMTVSLHDSNTAIRNGTLTLGNVTDLLQRGDVVIHDEDNNGKPKPGDTITIYDNNGKEIATGKTDSNGNLVFHDLPYGAYTVVNGSGGTASVALGGATSTATLVANPYTGAAGTIPPYAALGLFGLSLGGVLLGLKRKRKQ